MRFVQGVLFVFFISNFSASAQTTQLIRIDLSGRNLKELAAQGLALDHGEVYPGRFAYFNLLPDEIATVKKLGFKYTQVQAEDLEIIHPRNLLCFDPEVHQHPIPTHFRYGSMGGYYKYEEMNEILDSMHLFYPQLISERIQIDTFATVEGRKMEFLRISNNPETDQNKPAVLFTALHHAREPISLSQLVMFMWYLLENYDANPQVKQLIDNSELYFIPCTNPDGYVTNQLSNPNGGGYWRKNRWRNESGAIRGVDINRNYGQFWGFDDVGSSGNESSNVFRGVAPFSEPEIKAVRFLSEQQKFGLVLNYHSYGNDLIHPYGHIQQLCPDDKQFKNIGSLFTESNNYVIGTSYETLGYFVNGDSDDWQYEGIPGHKAYSYTPEIGSTADGFWPDKSRIIPLCQSVQLSNYEFVKMAQGYFRIQLLGNSFVTGKSENIIPMVARKYGIKDGPTSFTVRVITGNATIENVPHIFDIQTAELYFDSISLKPNAGLSLGDQIKLEFTNDMNGFTEKDTFTLTYAPSLISFKDNAQEAGRIKSNLWGRDNSMYFSPDFSYADSPGSNYLPNTHSIMVLNKEFQIPDSTDSYLVYKAKWDIEQVFDYAQVFAISGSDTIPLCGKYSEAGGIFQKLDEPIYEGKQDWVSELISLDDFKGETIKIGFSMNSDSLNSKDGIYVDDIEVFTPSRNQVKIKKLTQNEVSIYPNPVSGNDILHIESTFSIEKLSILTLNGISLVNVSPGSNKVNLPLPSIQPGIYILKMQTGNGNLYCKKLIIN